MDIADLVSPFRVLGRESGISSARTQAGTCTTARPYPGGQQRPALRHSTLTPLLGWTPRLFVMARYPFWGNRIWVITGPTAREWSLTSQCVRRQPVASAEVKYRIDDDGRNPLTTTVANGSSPPEVANAHRQCDGTVDFFILPDADLCHAHRHCRPIGGLLRRNHRRLRERLQIRHRRLGNGCRVVSWMRRQNNFTSMPLPTTVPASTISPPSTHE